MEQAGESTAPLFSGKDLKRLIAPLIIEQILMVLVGMADVVMVSSAGEAAVSGVSLVDMINVLIINVFAALATGGAVVSAQLLGAGKPDKACESAGQLLTITFMISVIIMVVTLAVREPLLRLLFGSIENDVMDSAMIYFWITALSYPFIALYNSCAALFRSMNNSRITMVVSLGMNVINVAGNAFFVYGFHMGTAGVAWPSLISRVLASVAMLWLIRNPQNVIHISLRSFFCLKAQVVKKILYIGIPSALENSMFQLGRVLVVSIIAQFGTVQIAANAVANTLDSMGCIPGSALSLAMITVVGQCVGAGDYKQASHFTKKLMKLTYLIMGVVCAGILLALPLLLKLYNLSPETARMASILVWIHDGCAILLWPASFTLPNALRAANDVKFTMVVSIFSMWVFRIIFSWVLGSLFGLGAIGVWIAMVMDWIFRGALFIWRFISGKWKRVRTV